MCFVVPNLKYILKNQNLGTCEMAPWVKVLAPWLPDRVGGK